MILLRRAKRYSTRRAKPVRVTNAPVTMASIQNHFWKCSKRLRVNRIVPPFDHRIRLPSSSDSSKRFNKNVWTILSYLATSTWTFFARNSRIIITRNVRKIQLDPGKPLSKQTSILVGIGLLIGSAVVAYFAIILNVYRTI